MPHPQDIGCQLLFPKIDHETFYEQKAQKHMYQIRVNMGLKSMEEWLKRYQGMF